MICIFHFAGYSGNSNGVFNTADSLVAEHKLEWAALEYERICYETFDNRVRTLALNHKAQCQLDMYAPQAAKKTMLRVSYFGLSDSLVFESRKRAAYASYLDKDFTQASSQLFMVEQFLSRDYQSQVALLYALTLNELREWDKAKEKVIFWVNHNIEQESQRDSLLFQIQCAYDSKNFPKYRNPESAALWSTIIPGTGQLYSGYFWDAAFSVLMVSIGLGVAAVGILVFKYYVTSIVLGYGLFQRFYMAGVKRAEYLAGKKNYTRDRRYNNQLRDLIFQIQ